MPFDPSISALLDTLESFSGGKLTRRNDLGTLIHLAELHHKREVLQSLCFLAKFVSKSYGIMNRIGRDGQGYGALAAEFTSNLEKARSQAQQLIEFGSPGLRKEFGETYFAMTPEALSNFLALLYDLSWYKNWQIDHPGEFT